ncbi:MAG: hypothetical protein RMJ98_17540, partial [Myxococcales bacterium]|nr:hypothetical protein [Myxococcales bacterium]
EEQERLAAEQAERERAERLAAEEQRQAAEERERAAQEQALADAGQGVVDLCEVLGINVTEEREAVLATLDLAALRALRLQLKSSGCCQACRELSGMANPVRVTAPGGRRVQKNCKASSKRTGSVPSNVSLTLCSGSLQVG